MIAPLRSTLEDVGGPLARKVGHEGWSERRAIWLRLTDARGRVGIGEACPHPAGIAGDLEACRVALEGLDRTRTRGIAPARFALESALIDLEGASTGKSAAQILGGGPVRYPWVERGGVLGPDADRWEDEIAALTARRIRTIKVKLGRAGFADKLARLRLLRSAIATLRVDLNGSFEPDEARRRVVELAEIEPELVEQPTSPAELLALGPTDVPWFADESMLDPEIATAVLRAPGCRGVVLKPAWIGLWQSRRWAEEALDRGLGVVVTHAFDGPVGLAAACALSMSLSARPLASGLDVHPGLAAFPPLEVSALSEPGKIIDAGRPGLGLGSSP
jgi:L-alanine-DL-glutamate epimerase-like enolase superfamily enzyme